MSAQPAPRGYWPAHQSAVPRRDTVAQNAMNTYEFVIARAFHILEQRDPATLTKQERRLLEALAPIVAGYRKREASCQDSRLAVR